MMGVGSVEEGLRRLGDTYSMEITHPILKSSTPTAKDEGREEENVEVEEFGLGRVFVIGGAEIYAHSLRLPNCERILWTKLHKEFDCDTFFPQGNLPVADGDSDGDNSGGEWRANTKDELEFWAMEEGIGGIKREGDVEFEVIMLEKSSV